MLQGVFFDFGDTLVPWSATLLKVHRTLTWPTFRRFRTDLTFEELQTALERADQRFTSLWGQHVEVHKFWLELAHELRISSFTESDAEVFNRRIWQRHLRVVRPFPGVLPTLRWLHNLHLKLAIVSNAWNSILDMYLNRLRLESLFAFVVTSEDAGALKSQLVPFQLALTHLDLVGGNVLHIGDRLDEDGACRKLGIRFAWLTLPGTRAATSPTRGSQHGHGFRVSSYAALRKAISGLLCA